MAEQRGLVVVNSRLTIRLFSALFVVVLFAFFAVPPREVDAQGLKASASASAAPAASPAPAGSASGNIVAPPTVQPPTSEEPTRDQQANAEQLFTRAKALHEAGNYREACPLFAESLRLDFGLGTLLFLSDCQDLSGQTASAWAGFKKAEDLAKSKGQTEREKIARDRAAVLFAKLSLLRVYVDPKNKDIGVVVKRNGVEVGEVVWGESLAVDPGTQTLTAEAPGYEAFKTTVEIPVGPSQSDAQIPPLVKAKDTPKTEGGGGINGQAMRIAGLSAGGVGLVGLILGTGFGIDAIKTYDDAVATCQDGNPALCTPEGVRLQESASRSALISTVSVSVGAACLVGGALLYFLAPSDAPADAKKSAQLPQLGVFVDGNGAFFTLGGVL